MKENICPDVRNVCSEGFYIVIDASSFISAYSFRGLGSGPNLTPKAWQNEDSKALTS